MKTGGGGHFLVRWLRSASFWVGAALGCTLAAATFELPYVNWHSVAPPIDAQPLIIRQDAKGDGRFFAPRSGNHHHRGVDLVAALNSPVRAIRSGTVVQVGLHRGLGRFIELEHRHQLHSLYAHLHDVSVEVGARVRQGAVIGTVGKTGNARHPWITPHLHLEVLKDGEPIDPKTLGLQLIDPSLRFARSPSPPSQEPGPAPAIMRGGPGRSRSARGEVERAGQPLESSDARGGE